MEKIKPVLLLTGILSLLLILLFVTGNTNKEKERKVVSLITLDPDTISALSIKTGNRPAIQLSRTEGSWVIQEPLYSLASRKTMDSVIETLDKLVGIPLDMDRDSDLNEFGLQGKNTITVKTVDHQGNEQSFSLGNQIPLDVGYVYTYVPSSGEFYKAYKDARSVFDLPLEDFRDKTVVDISINSIESVKISGTLPGDMSPVIVEKQPPWWEITGPKAAPGNNGKVKELLEGILSLRTNDFPESFEENEGKSPELRIRFTSADGSAETVSFYSDYGDDLQYVKSDRVPYALGIPRGVIENLPVRFDELRSKAVLRFDPSVIREIILDADTERITLQKEEDRWYIASAKDIPVDESAVRHLINLLTLREVEDISANRELKKSDTSIRLRVLLREENGAEHTVELGETGERDFVPGFSSFRDRPFIVPAEFFDHFQIDTDFFEDKHLLSFESRNIGSVQIRGNREDITLTKSGSDWLLTEPERSAADSPKSWGLVFALEKLVYEERISPAEFGTSGFSADNPDYSISIKDSNGKEQGKLDLWLFKAEGEAVAVSSYRDGFFLISGELLENIPVDHRELMYRK